MRRSGCLALIAGIVLIAMAAWVLLGWSGTGPATRPLNVEIAQGSSLASAGEQLEKAGAIRSASRFRLHARLFGRSGSIKAGEFAIPAGASESTILSILQGGKAVQRLVVIPEGLPSVMVRDRLMAAEALTGSVGVPAEGSILPDGYSFERDEARAAVLARMQAAMKRYVAASWSKRQPTTVARTPREAVILASIVEKETGKPSERRMVAAVYSNRLRIGMPLQADPTVIYPITHGRPLGRRIKQSELRAKNGYNTYASPGLPVGPVANPGRLSIDAVLNPAQTRALYFVADGTGGHVFADTLAEHNANVKKWYAIRHARGEM
ncbi:endolytic transglycosylase MltG [Sphingomonas sp. Mn802worker]|uniref:endolytic transglycosylase MltG n=1 Tax=Sphingomonas sp. Mn802worker TaxID=629773 RepID=UPI0004760100|nr:endolytic transglycosylase MltG [Sphingomonas sp. Mn802worker]